MQSIDEMIEAAYNREENYRILKNKVSNGLCYIYCSSNALYEKNSAASFQRRILEQDRYEWEILSAEVKPECEIYIRDLWLSWYVKGINATINSYEKLIAFLKEMTKGYRVRCVGASSGGFIGNILAMELRAECCFCFAGQFSLRNHFDHLQVNPLLRRYLESSGDEYFEYYRRLGEAQTNIVYLFPAESKQDKEQYALIEKCENVITIKVNAARHGIALYPYGVRKYISYDLEQCRQLSGVIHDKRQLSIRIGGLWNCVKYYTRKLIEKLFRR